MVRWIARQPVPIYAVLIALYGFFAPVPAIASEGSSSVAPARCEALPRVDLSTLQDAPTQITGASVAPSQNGEDAYCLITGYVASRIGFELHLPLADWNGKFIEIGCGAACGNTVNTVLCPSRRHYACIASDMGHMAKDQDMLWALNNLQAQLDYDTRGPHVVALAGKAITSVFYGKPSSWAFFFGCSNGGVQGLIEAQRFPWDFNEIVSLAGVPNYSDMNVGYLWGVRALLDSNNNALLTRQDLTIVHDAALARCDLDDGVADGVIGNPTACSFNPEELLCKGRTSSGCLTRVQVDAVKKMYEGPVNSRQEKGSFIGGYNIGSELGWVDYPGLDSVTTDSGPGGLQEWVEQVFRYDDGREFPDAVPRL